MKRRNYTNQHGAFVPTETEAIGNMDHHVKGHGSSWSEASDRRDAVRAILKLWGKADRENEHLYQEQSKLAKDIDALRGLQSVNMDGLPHGNKVTHPTEDAALAVMDMLRKKRDRINYVAKRISENERLLAKIDYAMILARNADLLRRYYHDAIRPMQKVAEEFHVDKRTAWRMESAGIDSIMRLFL